MSRKANRYIKNNERQVLIQRHINSEHLVELAETSFNDHTIDRRDITDILLDIDKGNSYE